MSNVTETECNAKMKPVTDFMHDLNARAWQVLIGIVAVLFLTVCSLLVQIYNSNLKVTLEKVIPSVSHVEANNGK
jgi:hypothetical protein